MFAAHEPAYLNVAGFAPIGVEDRTARKVGSEVRFKWTASISIGTGIAIEYALDGGAFTSADVSHNYNLEIFIF